MFECVDVWMKDFEWVLEFMVEMRCGGCAVKVTTACEAFAGMMCVDVLFGMNMVMVIMCDVE